MSCFFFIASCSSTSTSLEESGCCCHSQGVGCFEAFYSFTCTYSPQVPTSVLGPDSIYLCTYQLGFKSGWLWGPLWLIEFKYGDLASVRVLEIFMMYKTLALFLFDPRVINILDECSSALSLTLFEAALLPFILQSKVDSTQEVNGCRGE